MSADPGGEKPKAGADSASSAVAVRPPPDVEAGLHKVVLGSRFLIFGWLLINGFDLLWIVAVPSLQALRPVVVSVGALALLAGVALSLYGSRTPWVLIVVALGAFFAVPKLGNLVFLGTLIKGSRAMQEYGWNALRGPPAATLAPEDPGVPVG